MGLDVSHDCWHGAYSAFMRWREKLAEVAGLPPLVLMEGFYEEGTVTGDPCWASKKAPPDDIEWASWRRAAKSLPIKWSSLKKDVLHELLYHSDCDGELRVGILKPLADRLEELLPFLPDENAGGHIGNWREKTEQFISGLRDAVKEKKPVTFQ